MRAVAVLGALLGAARGLRTRQWRPGDHQFGNGALDSELATRVQRFGRELADLWPGSSNLCIDGRLAPEFLLLGAQKASTTQFAEVFDSNPGVVMPRMRENGRFLHSLTKELHFFDVPSEVSQGRAHWLSFYPRCSQAKRFVSTDQTPNYLFTRSAPGAMASFYSEQKVSVKFAVILRDPARRLQSAFYQAKSSGWNEGRLQNYTFAGYVRETLAGREPCEHAQHSEYAGQLRNWFEHFSPAQFTIVPFGLNLSPAAGEKSAAESMWSLLGLKDVRPQRIQRRQNIGRHAGLEEDLGPPLLAELSEWLEERMGARKVAEILSAQKPRLYGYRGQPGDVEGIAEWLRAYW